MAIKKRIILAAGHGAGDPGAVYRGTTEAIENIQITDLVAHYLRQAGGFEVHVVPHTLNLGGQIDWVNARWKNLLDGLAVEIHKNAGGGTGNEVWTPSYPDATIKAAAQNIVDEMTKTTGLANRGVKYAQNSRFGRLGWCDDVRTYALLVEAGFLDVDPFDDAWDKKYARGIANGILKFFGSTKTVPAPKASKKPARKSNETIANEVMAGHWGNGDDRIRRIRAAGYDYHTIQAIVNRKLGAPVTTDRKTISQLAAEVIEGKWGNGDDRQKRIARAGYDFHAVQAAVNARLGVPGAAPAGRAITKGSKVQVTNPVDVNGTRLAVSGTYDVIEVKGDRVVIGKGKKVTAAIRRQNLRRV